MDDDTNAALETFRRAAKNGQPMLALESLVSVVDWLLNHGHEDQPVRTVRKTAKATEETPDARQED